MLWSGSLHGFAGWYDADGVQVYDGSGNAATASSKYWTADPSGNPVWNYREDIIVYAHYSEDYYIIHYDKGESDNSVSMPADAAVMEGGGTTLADGRIYGGSGYIASFDTNVEPDTTSFASIPNAVLGNFPFLHWDIEGSAYGENGKNLYYEKPGAGNKEVITATAVYADASVTLPSTSRRGYIFKGAILGTDTVDNNMVLESAKGKDVRLLVTTFYQEGGSPEFDAGIKQWLNDNPDMMTNNGGNDIVAGVTAMGYDAYFTALEAVKAADSTDPAAILAALPGVHYEGVTGVIEFDDIGDAKRDAAYIKEANTETGAWEFVAVQTVEQ